MYRHFIKPLCDFLSAIFLLISLSPIIVLTGILLYIGNKGNIFFIQKRPGLNNKTFKIIKFKTMRDEFDEHGILLEDKLRVTNLGFIIRSASLDELLQLINVLKGDMSLVGPRPLLIQYLERYNSEQIKRHNVKPGITGWAQVNGRNAISWEQKFKLDLEYVEKQSFYFDLKILLITFLNVIKRKEVNNTEDVTMNEFFQK
jgi:lipopolysaccharide/colanic/teichoic acid biosynthesis glycosyltransferase